MYAEIEADLTRRRRLRNVLRLVFAVPILVAWPISSLWVAFSMLVFLANEVVMFLSIALREDDRVG